MWAGLMRKSRRWVRGALLAFAILCGTRTKWDLLERAGVPAEKRRHTQGFIYPTFVRRSSREANGRTRRRIDPTSPFPYAMDRLPAGCS